MVRSARRHVRLLVLLGAVCVLAVLASPDSPTVAEASVAVEQWSLAWRSLADCELSVADRTSALVAHVGQGAAAAGAAAAGLVGDVAHLVGRTPTLLS